MVVNIFAKCADIIGVIGVIFMLIAYYLLNLNRMSANSMNYQLLNFFGAIFVLFSLYFSWNMASALIEAAWVLISLMGMVRIIRSRSQEKL